MGNKVLERIQMECQTCCGLGTVGDYGDEIGEPIDCPKCNGLGTIWEYPEEPEYEPEDE